MDTDVLAEKSEELLALARQHGYPISVYQLARWHRAGLLPRPQQHPLKGGRGTCSLYPPGTGEQLLLLCSLRTCERRLAHLAWRVWLAGYRVEGKLIRIQLQRAAVRLTLWWQWLAGFKQAASQADAEQTLDWIECYAQGPLRWQPLRRIRKRVGRKHFSTFLSRLLDLTTEDGSERAVSDDEYEWQLDMRILARGLGLEKRFTSKRKALEYYLLGFLLPRLRWFFRWSQELAWEELLEHVTAFEVLQARDELLTWLMRQGTARQLRDQFPDDYPLWEIDLQEYFRALSPDDQALVLVVWLALRTLPSSWRDRMPAIIIGPDGCSYANPEEQDGKAHQTW
ncbi:hypothetical protein EPA93_32695 [Ktedonosporobacter rubrisoli]|uniref:Uncharacterized protein n=1 Tax=Ktedonosporobacter rubrisoli TaxID=2509675 RepID=A0A4P6JXJ6_KTERU|nr:hypothetical protein [Ktedonosporobacter rubrisoli]QBD80478.1 hypothetical protein EPA93_32695 [Ktedonosporobacter rubrisoli]